MKIFISMDMEGISGIVSRQETLPVGAHTRFGHARGIISHTITRPFAHVRINGERVDEVKLATAMAGHMGVPVGLVTGDDAICEETKAWLPQVETAVRLTLLPGVERTGDLTGSYVSEDFENVAHPVGHGIHCVQDA